MTKDLTLSILLTGKGLWLKRTWANKLADTIVTLHGLVLLNLIVLFAFKQPVALISIMAMLFRTLVWVGVILLTRWRIKGQEGKYIGVAGNINIKNPTLECSRPGS